jgi:hypothetical protein
MKMIIRRIVLVLGAVVVLIGLSQVFAASWWLKVMPGMMAPHGMRILGGVALLVGVVLLDAAVRRAVGLRPFVLIIGILMLFGGAILLFNPGAMHTFWASWMNRPHESQMTMTWIAGLVRAAIGILLVYAATRAATPGGTHHAGV